MAKRAAKYRRISDDKEGRELGVTRQGEDLDALAQRLGLDVVADYPDNDISASTRSRKERPEYKRMIEDARAGRFDVILAYSSSRLTRRPRENEDLIDLAQQHGIRFAYVQSPEWNLNTADGREYARMAAARDAGEAERTSERVRDAARDRARKGEWHGGRAAPLGYVPVHGEVTNKYGRTRVKVVSLKLDPVYAPLLREAARRLLAGESLYSICNDWNRRGITTRQGARWVSATLRRPLLAASAIGMRSDPADPSKLYETGWKPVLDREDWDRLRELMSDPGRRFKPADGYAGKYALGGGVTLCGNVIDDDGTVCGKKLMSQKHRGLPRLICATAVTGGCGHVLITYEPLERFVLDMVLARLDSPKFRAALNRRRPPRNDAERALRDELDDLDAQRRRVGDAVVIGAYTKSEGEDKVRELDEAAERLRARLSDLQAERVRDADEALRAEDALKLWESADTSRRRRFIQSFVTAVRVKPFPAGMTTTLTRRRGESDESLRDRRAEHAREALRRRVEIAWRR